MKKFCCWVIVLLAVVAGLGFYRGWFVLSSHSSQPDSPKVDVNLTVDSGKMKTDAESVKDKTRELTGQGKE